jgi:hypothetical protein
LSLAFDLLDWCQLIDYLDTAQHITSS